MAYRQLGPPVVLASITQSNYYYVGTYTGLLGARKILVLVYGGTTAGPQVDGMQVKGCIDGATSTDNGDRTFTLIGNTPASPVGVARGAAIAIAWTPGRIAAGSTGGWNEYPFPGAAINIHTGAGGVAGPTTNVTVEVWAEDAIYSGSGATV